MKFSILGCLTVMAVPYLASSQGSAPQGDAEHHHTVVPLMENGILKARGSNYQVLSGDPAKAGAPFVIRIHNYDNQIVPPHWHPEDEHIVLVKGRWFIAQGDVFDRSALREVKTGDYVFMPKQMRHFGWSNGETVIQVHGIGPFKINLAQPWKVLSDPKAADQFKYKENQAVHSSRGQGIIRFGVRSDDNKVIQYAVEKADGGVYYAFEDELTGGVQ